ncbi:MAG: FtsW/RodA/SpoVE family cell cycle protein [Candidatus Pacebacteria bacterium]|nr:FtsW/RodA/SpoVE family cell cycle protein [Candidatus Paceibacterota bacterium]
MKQWFLLAFILSFALLSVVSLASLDQGLASRQLIFFLLGVSVFFGVQKLSFSKILRFSPWFYFLVITLLVAVLFLPETRGTHRWLSFGGLFDLQPSQLAVPAVLLFILELKETTKKTAQYWLRSFASIIVIGSLVFLEPDLGMSLLVGFVSLNLVWLQPLKSKYVIVAILIGVIVSFGAWSFLLKPYQKLRITSFINPTAVETASNYNVRQSIIAVGSGQILGRGMEKGVQSQLQFLPEQETDFIFAAFSEEFGWVGSILVIMLYGMLLSYLLRFSRRLEGSRQLFLYSVFAYFLFQVSINIGMNLGLAPVTGLALPLFSYGGSSLLTTCGMLGITQVVLNETRQKSALHIA